MNLIEDRNQRHLIALAITEYAERISNLKTMKDLDWPVVGEKKVVQVESVWFWDDVDYSRDPKLFTGEVVLRTWPNWGTATTVTTQQMIGRY